MDKYDLIAQLAMGQSIIARWPTEHLMADVEPQEMDSQLAHETMHSFITDLRAMLGMMEAVYTLDTAQITHPHGMADGVRAQRNALLGIPRKLCRAEALERWNGLVDRFPTFLRALDTQK